MSKKPLWVWVAAGSSILCFLALVVGIYGGLAYVIVHFVLKFW